LTLLLRQWSAHKTKQNKKQKQKKKTNKKQTKKKKKGPIMTAFRKIQQAAVKESVADICSQPMDRSS
jgi:type II secretory ATPase GspE/PulE/Tfp pilus assembly ATPase PilB-like protein